MSIAIGTGIDTLAISEAVERPYRSCGDLAPEATMTGVLAEGGAMTTAATGSANTGGVVADPSKGKGREPADTQKSPKEAFLAVAYSRSLH